MFIRAFIFLCLCFVGVKAETLRILQNQSQSIKIQAPVVEVGVANPQVANAKFSKPDILHVFGLTPGRTSVFVVDETGNVAKTYTVFVERDVSSLRQDVRRMFPEEKVIVYSLNSAIVLRGDVTSPRNASLIHELAKAFADKDPVINQLSVTCPNQVHLRVKVAEVSRNVTDDFGVNWRSLLKIGNPSYGIATNFASTLVDTAQINYSFIDSNVNIDGVLNALAGRGSATVLAEPDLTTVSGKSATVLAGGEFPIPISNNNGQIEVSFREFGVRLSFTPVILDSGRVQLHIIQEVSELSDANSIVANGIRIPGLKTRKAESTVDLASGQGVAFAGLLQNNTLNQYSAFMGLDRVPILGALFKSSKFTRNESELVFIVSSYLVNPTDKPEKLQAPTDNHVPTPDYKRVAFSPLTENQKKPILWGTHAFKID